MPVPFSFGAATTAIPLSQLDSNFNTPITLGNTAIQLGNTVTTLNNMTLANVTISSGNVTITNVTVTTANATTVNTTTLIATTANVTTGNVTNLISGNVTLTGGSITGTTISGSTGSFTTLTTSSTVTLNGGTANGVAYLNGSKVLTTGSALTFDGTKLTSGAFGNTGRRFEVNGSEALLDGAGQFDLVMGDGGVAYMSLTTTDNATGLKIRNYSDNSDIAVFERTTGNVGIGTSSPSAKLQVNSGDIRIVQTNNSANNGLYFRNAADSGTYAKVAYVAATGEFQVGTTDAYSLLLQTNNTTKATLDSSGNLGLGVTPSAWAAGWNAQQIGYSYGLMASSSVNAWYQLNNSYFDGSFKYKNNGVASSYEQGTVPHVWKIAPSGTAGDAITFTQALTLDASGNLGVGTTNPLQKLVVSNAGAEGLEISPTAIASGSALISYNRSGAAYTQLTASALRHVWQVSGTESARITSTGYFKASNAGTYLNSTGDYHELRSSNDNYLLYAINTRNGGGGPFGISVEYSAQDPNGTGNEFLQCVGISTLRAEIRSNGGLANYSANDVNLSDRREKTNFAPAKSYLDTICAIPVQTFNYIDQSEDDPGLTLGVVAQDVQAVAPELVMESNWGTEDNPKMRLSIYQTDLQYALMKALQELKAEFDAYKATHP